jgi:hypothetical protein
MIKERSPGSQGDQISELAKGSNPSLHMQDSARKETMNYLYFIPGAWEKEIGYFMYFLDENTVFFSLLARINSYEISSLFNSAKAFKVERMLFMFTT